MIEIRENVPKKFGLPKKDELRDELDCDKKPRLKCSNIPWLDARVDVMLKPIIHQRFMNSFGFKRTTTKRVR
ncbi:hypothetical protein GCM10008967_25880 [Bacillus carboniphilus]|uniref:Uncharacterized protein n=1 Tax=Bacillus carboniphilus TaxID=86663 RepID=A0ABP3G445_9BACI